jgi:MEMO1 family protein
MIREPYLAGTWYPAAREDLSKCIEKYSLSGCTKTDVVGVISPHAGYIYSGSVAGAVFCRIRFSNTCIIIGPNHSGSGKPFGITTEGRWNTPLGEASIDSVLAKAIFKSSSYLGEDNDDPHKKENSIELQLPFLQYFKPGVKIVPILLSHARPDVYEEIGRALVQGLRETGEEAIIVASSDMTHYEPQEKAKAKDRLAIEAIVSLDADELVRLIARHNISMCGYAPVISLITAARELGAQKAELVKYQTSGDSSGDYSSVVGYAGIIISK